jgi:hypothetical protein
MSCCSWRLLLLVHRCAYMLYNRRFSHFVLILILNLGWGPLQSSAGELTKLSILEVASLVRQGANWVRHQLEVCQVCQRLCGQWPGAHTQVQALHQLGGLPALASLLLLLLRHPC